MSKAFDWRDIDDDRLRDLAEKFSAAEIGKQLGCSRNAVIGRCSRRGIDLCSTPAPRAPARIGDRPNFTVRAEKLAVVEPVEILVDHLELTILQLRPDSCRWPLWVGNVPFDDKRYCGNRTRTGASYCARCERLSISPRRTASVDRKLGFFRLPRAA